MPRYDFHLNISPERCLDYYRGVAKHVVVRATTGQTVQFPANRIQPFVTVDGVQGRFSLVCDADNRCIGLERIS